MKGTLITNTNKGCLVGVCYNGEKTTDPTRMMELLNNFQNHKDPNKCTMSWDENFILSYSTDNVEQMERVKSNWTGYIQD